MPRFLLRKDAAEIGKFAHRLGIEDISRDPIQRLQIAQTTAAFLDIRLDNKRAVAIPPVAKRAFGLLSRDILGGPASLQAARKRRWKSPNNVLLPVRNRASSSAVRIVVSFRSLQQAVPDRPRRVAHLQSKVPEEIQHVFHHTQRFRRGILGGQEQQIDIAERCQHARP